MITARRSPLALIAAAAAIALSLSGCQGATAPAAEPAAPAASWPRTIAVPGADGAEPGSLTLEARPTQVAALSYETAEVAAALGAVDRLVLVPEATRNLALGNHAEELAAVPASFESESSLNTEAVIAAGPDLVLMNGRHGLGESVGSALRQAGIPVLVLPNSWSTPAELDDNIALIGQALGEEAAAGELAAELEAGLTAATPSGEPERVLVLSNQAGRPFVTAGRAFPLELLRLAGAEDASAALGLDRTGPITVEQVLSADPDRILLIDMNGSGDRLFAPIMANPAVAALPAAQNPLLLQGKQTQALGLGATVTGLDAIRAWLAGGEG